MYIHNSFDNNEKNKTFTTEKKEKGKGGKLFESHKFLCPQDKIRENEKNSFWSFDCS